MQSPEHREFQSEFARKYVSLGKAEGKAEGEAKGKAEAILRVLECRSIHLSDAQREVLLGTTNMALLDLWLDRAIVATTANDVFG